MSCELQTQRPSSSSLIVGLPGYRHDCPYFAVNLGVARTGVARTERPGDCIGDHTPRHRVPQPSERTVGHSTLAHYTAAAEDGSIASFVWKLAEESASESSQRAPELAIVVVEPSERSEEAAAELARAVEDGSFASFV